MASGNDDMAFYQEMAAAARAVLRQRDSHDASTVKMAEYLLAVAARSTAGAPSTPTERP
ncbi:MAG: hypothetical protein HY985_02360 [Magnetospirillum sp.]|nr:hypothetical protein [Magnetospirillum sp.]